MLCRDAFPNMSSYSRFVERYPRAILPMVALLHTCMASCEGASFVDSTPLRVYNNHRIYCHKVFADSAARGKPAWDGSLASNSILLLTTRRIALLRAIPTTARVWKNGHTHYLNCFLPTRDLDKMLQKKLVEEENIHLIAGTKKEMKNKPEYSTFEWALLKKWGIIETVIDELKHLMQVGYSRHCSYTGFMMNLLSGLVAYCWMRKKTVCHFTTVEQILDIIEFAP